MTTKRIIALIVGSSVLVGSVVLAISEIRVGQKPLTFSYQQCELDAMFGAMEQYGRVGVVYTTKIFDDADPNQAWSASFNSRNTSIKVELKAHGSNVCEAVSVLYDKWYQIPFQYVEAIGNQ